VVVTELTTQCQKNGITACTVVTSDFDGDNPQMKFWAQRLMRHALGSNQQSCWTPLSYKYFLRYSHHH
jgi:hypothetical protein